jgi:hypothetical protein
MEVTPGTAGSTRRFTKVLRAAVLLIAAVATFAGVAVVVLLLSWVRSTPERQVATVPLHVPQQPAAVVRRADTVVAVSPTMRRPQRKIEPVARVAAAVPQIASTPSETPGRGPNSDAEKNRAIGRGLSRLAEDPDLQRRLGLDSTPP